MYEDTKFKSKTDWKSLFIKLAILLVVVFIICFIIFRPKNNKIKVSLTDNIMTVKESSINYFKENPLKDIGDHDKVSLHTLINKGFLDDQSIKKQKCDQEKSYVYLTKTRDDEYVLKISLTCSKVSQSQVFDITNNDLEIIAVEDETVEEVIVPEEVVAEETITEEQTVTEPNLIKSEETKNTTYTNKRNRAVVASNESTNNGKTLRYKHVAYGNWQIGDKTGSSIENSTKTVHLYCYCLNGNCVEDLIDSIENYVGYTASYSRTVNVPVYRYVYTVWSNSKHINGFINTGITEYR